MFGVVLWSDTKGNKAVIWCEDHGDLAYFSGSTDLAEGCDGDLFTTLDAGDLVHFDLREGARMRQAHNPRRVELGGHAQLAEMLRAQSRKTPRSALNTPTKTTFSAQIIPFARKGDCRPQTKLVAI